MAGASSGGLMRAYWHWVAARRAEGGSFESLVARRLVAAGEETAGSRRPRRWSLRKARSTTGWPRSDCLAWVIQRQLDRCFPSCLTHASRPPFNSESCRRWPAFWTDPLAA